MSDPKRFYQFLLELGDNLRRHRKNVVHKSQEDVASDAGVTRPTLSGLESPSVDSDPKISTLIRVCDALGTDLSRVIPSSSDNRGDKELQLLWADIHTLPDKQREEVIRVIRTYVDGLRARGR